VSRRKTTSLHIQQQSTDNSPSFDTSNVSDNKLKPGGSVQLSREGRQLLVYKPLLVTMTVNYANNWLSVKVVLHLLALVSSLQSLLDNSRLCIVLIMLIVLLINLIDYVLLHYFVCISQSQISLLPQKLTGDWSVMW